jgi:hypothetical protein
MSTYTFDQPVRRGEPAGRTPRVELDVPLALTAMRTAGLQVVPDTRGGTMLDVGHPGIGPLFPYLPATGTWMWVTDAHLLATMRRTSRPLVTVVLDGRARPGEYALESRADLVVLPLDQIEAKRPDRSRVPALLDLTELSHYRIRPRVLAAPAALAGFHLDLTGVPNSAMAERMDALTHALRRWHVAGRHERPLLVLRGARPVLARWVVDALRRVSRRDDLPLPVLRVDVTPTVLKVAVRTVVRVVDVDSRRGQAVLQVDGIPSATGCPMQVLQPRQVPTAPADVMLRHHGKLVTARIEGGPVGPGSELAAAGWTETEGFSVVLGFPTTDSG